MTSVLITVVAPAAVLSTRIVAPLAVVGLTVPALFDTVTAFNMPWHSVDVRIVGGFIFIIFTLDDAAWFTTLDEGSIVELEEPT